MHLLIELLLRVAVSVSTIADARNAVERLHGVFVAELVTEDLITDPTLDCAVEAKNASFTWDSAPQDLPQDLKKAKISRRRTAAPAPAPDAPKEVAPEKLFKINNLDLVIPRGQLVAIVGPVGAGKTSMLQGLIGEMRKTEGSVKFGGSVAYCSQSAWIQNATIRENICFGRPFETERYWKAVHDACLDADLDMLPNGDLTEVGEKVK